MENEIRNTNTSNFNHTYTISEINTIIREKKLINVIICILDISINPFITSSFKAIVM